MPANKNLLDQSTSPYLLQHKDNPVHWRPWSAESLAEAKELNKPILLSIGYAACHWCHVMAHESFEDDEVAQVMNDLFVNIKVDREERPDIDTIYMSALHSLGEQGGWPLTMFLTPDAEPFWGGTYFPKTPRYGRPGFIQVMTEISRIFSEEPQKVDQNRAAILERLANHNAARERGEVSNDLFLKAGGQILSISDPANGGLRGAPKFPQSGMLETLWRCGQQSGNPVFEKTALFGLERMAMGGIYDHLAGGFARYTVDDKWLVPHFEKMLYDNALILSQMVTLWPVTKSRILEKATAETIAWLERDMQIDGGGLASSYDADSEGVEGKFYVWSLDEVVNVLGEKDAELFATYYDISAAGNWEGHNIPNRLHDEALADDKTEARLSELCARLLKVREKRVWPGLDDKVLADWNGLAITAITRAARVFEKAGWQQLAETVFHYVSESMADGEGLHHSSRNGACSGNGMLADYANMIQAALTLYEVTGSPEYLEKAIGWTAIVEARFASPDGGYFMTPDATDDLILRPRSAADDAVPNGNGTMVWNLVRLAAITGDPDLDARAQNILSAFSGDIVANPLAHTGLLNGFDQMNRQVMVVTGKTTKKAVESTRAKLNTAPVPYPLFIAAKNKEYIPKKNIANTALAKEKDAVHICIPGACLPPASSNTEIEERLAEAQTAIAERL